MIDHGTDKHNGKNYKMPSTKIGCMITRVKRLVSGTPISAEDYNRKEISEINRIQKYDKLNKLIDYLSLLNQHEYLSSMEQRRKRHHKT